MRRMTRTNAMHSLGDEGKSRAARRLCTYRYSATFKAVALRATTPHPTGFAGHLPPQGGKRKVEKPFMTIARLFAALFLFCCIGAAASAARADTLDDTLALFLDDKFPQTEKAIGQLALSGAPTGAQILEALADNRLFIDKGSKTIVFKNAAGEIFSAKTGEKAAGVDEGALKKVRVNNGLRSAIDAAVGSMTLASPDPAKRVAGADAVFKSHDPKDLPAVEAALAKEKDARAAKAFQQARAAILVTSADAPEAARLAAVGVLKERGDQDALGLIGEMTEKASDGPLKTAGAAAIAAIKARLALWDIVQNLWYGLSASSVLLLAAIGLAITFGVMGVINMAHGEMVMLGAYSTFIVQSLI